MTAAIVAFLRPLLLPLLLAASLAGNAWQWRDAAVRAAVDDTQHRADVRLAEETGRAIAAEAYADSTTAALVQSTADAEALLGRMRALYVDADRRLGRYSERIAAIPEPTCAPGQARQDATNDLLRGD